MNTSAHSYANHSTHSGSIIERVVVSNKVVSTGKKARSAHVEIPKVERFRMMEGAKEGMESARRSKDPQLCHEVNTLKHVPRLFSASSLLFYSAFPIPLRFTLFEGCARLSCILALSGTYGVHDKRMKSAGVEGKLKVLIMMGPAYSPHGPYSSEHLSKIPWK